MAASLINRAASRTETFGAFRLSLNLLRNFSSPAAASPSTENPSSDPIKAKRRKKNKNLIEVAQFSPNWGIGYHLAKAHWDGVSYEISTRMVEMEKRGGLFTKMACELQRR